MSGTAIVLLQTVTSGLQYDRVHCKLGSRLNYMYIIVCIEVTPSRQITGQWEATPMQTIITAQTRPSVKLEELGGYLMT